MGWIIPVLRNNWGYEEVFLGQWAMNSSGSMATDAGVPKLFPGLHKIRWPDRTEEKVEIHTKKRQRDVGDHGHYYRVTSDIPCFWVTHRGTRIELEIMESGCMIWSETSDQGER